VSPAAFEKLEPQATFAGARRGDDAHDLPVTRLHLRQGGLQRLHVCVAANEARQPMSARHIETRAQCTGAA
jgi:hypothetical protein